MFVASTRFPAFSPSWLSDVTREMDETFQNLVQNGKLPGRSAPLSVYESKDAVTLCIDVPGVRLEDLEVTVKEGKLFVSGERKPDCEEGECRHDERWFGKIERTFLIPEKIDASQPEASLDNGVLSIRMAKTREAQPLRVAITPREKAIEKSE